MRKNIGKRRGYTKKTAKIAVTKDLESLNWYQMIARITFLNHVIKT